MGTQRTGPVDADLMRSVIFLWSTASSMATKDSRIRVSNGIDELAGEAL